MFNVGGMQLLVVALVALIVLGPDKLPSFVRQAGQVMSELRRISTGFQADLKGALEEADAEARRDPPTPATTANAAPAAVSNDAPDAPESQTNGGGALEGSDTGEQREASGNEVPSPDAARAAAAAELEALVGESRPAAVDPPVNAGPEAERGERAESGARSPVDPSTDTA